MYIFYIEQNFTFGRFCYLPIVHPSLSRAYNKLFSGVLKQQIFLVQTRRSGNTAPLQDRYRKSAHGAYPPPTDARFFIKTTFRRRWPTTRADVLRSDESAIVVWGTRKRLRCNYNYNHASVGIRDPCSKAGEGDFGAAVAAAQCFWESVQVTCFLRIFVHVLWWAWSGKW